MLSAEQEQDLARKARAGDRAAFNRLVEANLRLVVSVARKYSLPDHVTLLDLIQEGNIGLLRAAERFDPERGFRFSTYATFWIRQAMGIAVTSGASIVSVPTYILELANRVKRMSAQLAQELGRDPLPEEVAARLKLTAAQVLELQCVAERCVSLDGPPRSHSNECIHTETHSQIYTTRYSDRARWSCPANTAAITNPRIAAAKTQSEVNPSDQTAHQVKKVVFLKKRMPISPLFDLGLLSSSDFSLVK